MNGEQYAVIRTLLEIICYLLGAIVALLCGQIILDNCL